MALNTKQTFELADVQLRHLRIALYDLAATAAQQYVNTRIQDHLHAAHKLQFMLDETYNNLPIAKYDKDFDKE